MKTTKIRTVGNSLGVILDRETLQAAGFREGDDIHIVARGEGLLLTRLSQKNLEVLKIGERQLEKYDDALRTLA
ncbi:MAG: AbrB/MazE/SpoVT family DNA-binding domain-containing protein [Azospirillum sp.]|nr:AbrB/MazE/SpoVT family DNA-binding domain-containing protein [Azospirillum sp.]